MGINVRLRYAVSWFIVRVLMTITGWIASGIILANVGIAMFALWFSSEFKQAETIRLLKSMDE